MPTPLGSHSLTGATRYRTGFRGVLVLQVEQREIAYFAGRLAPGVQRTPVYRTIWRDAKTIDLRVLEYLQQCEAGDNPPPPPD